MGWLNFKIFQNDNGTKSLTAEINNELKGISPTSIKWEVERELKRHFKQEFLARYAEEITKDISAEEIVKDAREAFRQSVKDKLQSL